MTIQQILDSEKATLSPADVAPIIGCSAYTVTLQAREDAKTGKSSFPFPVIVVGTRTRIPRIPFLKSMGYIT